jgi:HEAT repeat protein
MVTFLRTILLVLTVLCAGCSERSGSASVTPERIAEVRRKLDLIECGPGPGTLSREGDSLFPVYLAILEGPPLNRRQREALFHVLISVKGDREPFLKHATQALGDQDEKVRTLALNLLEQIGTAREAPLVLPLLSDPGLTVPYAAAKALAAIGGPAEAAGMETWLRSTAGDAHLRAHVKDQLRILRGRLGVQANTP